MQPHTQIGRFRILLKLLVTSDVLQCIKIIQFHHTWYKNRTKVATVPVTTGKSHFHQKVIEFQLHQNAPVTSKQLLPKSWATIDPSEHPPGASTRAAKKCISCCVKTTKCYPFKSVVKTKYHPKQHQTYSFYQLPPQMAPACPPTHEVGFHT